MLADSASVFSIASQTLENVFCNFIVSPPFCFCRSKIQSISFWQYRGHVLWSSPFFSETHVEPRYHQNVLPHKSRETLLTYHAPLFLLRQLLWLSSASNHPVPNPVAPDLADALFLF